MEPVIKTVEVGGGGGSEFGPLTFESIGFSGFRDRDNAVRIGFMKLDDKNYGLQDNPLHEHINLREGEYINSFTIRSSNNGRDDLVQRVILTTAGNGSQRLDVGGWTRNPRRPQEKRESAVRVFEVYGRSGSRLDKIGFRFVDHYKPSNEISSRVPAITGYYPKGATREEFTSSSVKKINTYKRTLETSVTRKISASAGVEINLKLLKISNKNEFVSTIIQGNKEEIIRTIETIERTDTINYLNVPDDHTCFMIADVDIFEDQSGNVFFLPSTDEYPLFLRDDNFSALIGKLNLVGTVIKDVTNLTERTMPSWGEVPMMMP